MSKPETLTAEVAEKVLLADVSNILKKAKSGKPLSKHERDIITAAKSEPVTPPARKGKGKPRKKANGFTWSLISAATEFGVSRETIRRGLIRAGIEQKAEYTTLEIVDAIFTDKNVALARKALAEAAKVERENRIADADVIPKSEYDAFCQKILLPIRQRILAMPAMMAQRTNPTDPAFALVACEQWRDETLKLLRTEIQKPEMQKAA